jgi:hypothetical protein
LSQALSHVVPLGGARDSRGQATHCNQNKRCRIYLDRRLSPFVAHVPVGARRARDNFRNAVGAPSWRDTDNAHIEHAPPFTPRARGPR